MPIYVCLAAVSEFAGQDDTVNGRWLPPERKAGAHFVWRRGGTKSDLWGVENHKSKLFRTWLQEPRPFWVTFLICSYPPL